MDNHSSRDWFEGQCYDESALNIVSPCVGRSECSNLNDQLNSDAAKPPLQYRYHGGGLLITGDTKPYADRLKGIGASWNRTLGGWTLGGRREARFRTEFADLL